MIHYPIEIIEFQNRIDKIQFLKIRVVIPVARWRGRCERIPRSLKNPQKRDKELFRYSSRYYTTSKYSFLYLKLLIPFLKKILHIFWHINKLTQSHTLKRNTGICCASNSAPSQNDLPASFFRVPPWLSKRYIIPSQLVPHGQSWITRNYISLKKKMGWESSTFQTGAALSHCKCSAAWPVAAACLSLIQSLWVSPRVQTCPKIALSLKLPNQKNWALCII